MRIGIDTRYIYDHFPGIGRYVLHLVHALAELPHQHTLVLLFNPSLPNSRHDLHSLHHKRNVEVAETNARPFSLAEQVQIPRLAHALSLDVLHSPYYIKPYFGLPCPSIVTLHDLIAHRFPETIPRKTRTLFNLMTWLAVCTSSCIITVSESSRRDIAHYYRVPLERISVTPEAADARFAPQPDEAIASVRAKYHLPLRYVFYLGANKPHKNLVRLVAAWERLITSATPFEARHLILAGHYDPRYPEVQRIVTERGLTSSVLFVPNVAEADLPALYSGADVFVYPSYYEGFGLPPLEAMACGVPVLCANASSLPEVVGDAALTANPYDIGDMAHRLLLLLINPTLRARLGEKGRARAQVFSWQRTAQETLRVYQEAARMQEQ